MTVSSTLTKHIYLGNGATKIFDYEYDVLDEDDLHIYLTEISTGTETEITTNFTVTPSEGSFPSSSGTIIYPSVGTAITSNYKLTVLRALEDLQPTVYPNNTSLKPKVVETSFDRITMITQQQREQLERTIQLSITSSPNISKMLPTPTADFLLGWDSTGTALVNTPRVGTAGSKSIDGGNAASVYLDIQIYNGGDANG